jgi:hypothetical protein
VQVSVVEWVANVADLGPHGYLVSPARDNVDPVNRAAFQLCSQQRIRNTGGYVTFSFFGVMLVVCIGSSIIIVSWCAELALELKRTEWNHHEYRETARVADQLFQLQRKALTTAGDVERWPAIQNDVPVTKPNTYFRTPRRHGQEDYEFFTCDKRKLTTSVCSGEDRSQGPPDSLYQPSMSQTRDDHAGQPSTAAQVVNESPSEATSGPGIPGSGALTCDGLAHRSLMNVYSSAA